MGTMCICPAQHGGRVQSELYDTVNHVTIVAALASVLRSRAPVLERVTAFVQANQAKR